MSAAIQEPAAAPRGARLFPTLFLAGFECASGRNAANQPLDQIAATQHDRFLREDYARLRAVGIGAVREGIRWPLVDRGGRCDLASIEPFVAAGREYGMLQVWDLFHYGYPEDLDPFASEFVERFARYCEAVARYLRPRLDGIPFFTPVNEISYFAWAAGDAALFAPHCRGRSFELKVKLARAAIRGIDAIRAVIPGARIVNADPICRVVPPREQPELAAEAHAFNEGAVFQAWDMLAGRLLPELGGSRAHLDLVGINYYWTNQWEHLRPGLPLADDDPRRLPLRDLVSLVHQRYGGDLLITETSHVGEHRGPWLRELAGEVVALWERGVPLQGVCLYPVLGMPEWHAPEEWARMGLWDLQYNSPTLRRVPCEPMLAALAEARALEQHPTWQAPLHPIP
jgi:hypothetical protein